MIKLYKTAPSIELWSNDTGDTFRLRRAMVYFIGDKTITVPKGFSCDGMSVPRFLWGIVSPSIHHDTIAAAIIHDYFYRNHARLYGLIRKNADKIFYAVMRSDGVPVWRALLAYIGVRLFGSKAWQAGGVPK